MLHEISFKSFNEHDEVQGWVYWGEVKHVTMQELPGYFNENDLSADWRQKRIMKEEGRKWNSKRLK